MQRFTPVFALALAAIVTGCGSSPTHAVTTVKDMSGPSSSCKPSCTTGETCCGTACASTQTDPKNCGSCNLACAAGETCTAGKCGTTSACTGCTKTCCSNACIDTTSDTNNCGGCGTVCAAGQSRNNGQCGTMNGGCTNCTGTCCMGNVCADTNSDPNNCGGCGIACPSGVGCSMGNCGATDDGGAGCMADTDCPMGQKCTISLGMGLPPLPCFAGLPIPCACM